MTETSTSRAAGGLPTPLARLHERAGLPFWGLPPPLAAAYGGDLGFARPCVYANFVASMDGVTALGPEYPSSGSAISGHDPADRFVMGLLRACADVVLIGAGTLRATPGHLWTPGHVCPAAADDYAALRRSLGRAADPRLAVVTARGDVPAGHPALRGGALILTTTAGARRLHGQLPPGCTILDLGERPALPVADLLAAIRARGGSMVLTEGGPRLLGRLVADGLLDELFLTVSPVLACSRIHPPARADHRAGTAARAGGDGRTGRRAPGTGHTYSSATRCRAGRTGQNPATDDSRRPGSRA